ncbi:uncharacterized protein LOC132601489 [Lycium barbarum]|uniref:uncharacterized protein LOC132601489 n=1 Tax=Lycium barbarum TaxID=112863 RepID=UPI00293F57AC|nr:uncharacterized protein LOC132601489 [Lycium barbarum]
MEKFYRGLDPITQSIANNAADACFMDKTYTRVTNILTRLTTHNQAWHSNNANVIPYGNAMIQNMVKENQNTKQTLAQLATNISLLTKKFDENQIKKVNVCEDASSMPKRMYEVQEGPYQEGPPMQVEDTNYVNSSQRGYQRQNYQVGYQNQNEWRPQQGQGQSNDQSSLRVEAMLEKVLGNQTKSKKMLSGLTEIVGSHTAAIQKLELQMRDISREQHPPKKRRLHSDTILNPKNRGGSVDCVFAISTRSGKKLQSAEKKEKVADIPESSKVADDKSKQTLKRLSLNFPFLDAVKTMPGFAKYLKDLLTKKKTVQHEIMSLTHIVSSIISTTTVQTKRDPGLFNIPCSVGYHDFTRALIDNGARLCGEVNSFAGLGSYSYNPKKLTLDLENRTTPLANPSIVEPPKLELKQVPSHLKYEFFGPNNMLSMIVSALLTEE